jgi:hypothetical protein
LIAQGGDHFFDMHSLAVFGGSAMVIEDFHGLEVYALGKVGAGETASVGR